ncbi:MAG: MFS transporter [Kofleriaceae bacterium]
MKAGRREWLGLAVIALPCILYAMDLTVLELAVPRIAADLHPSNPELLWILDVYGFVLAGALVTMGTLGDRIGRRKLLLAGATAFGLISVAAAFANSAPTLIALRALLGLAGATLAPSTLALITTMFHDDRERKIAIGVWGASFSTGGLLGPLLGGVALAHFWWGAVFLLGVPVMALLLLVGRRVLPEVKAERPGRLDVTSAALSLAAVLFAIYGIKAFAHGDQGGPWLAIGIAAGVVFVRRQRTLADPFIDLQMFRAPAFTTGMVVNVLGIFVVFGIYVFVAQDLQLVRGLSPLEAGVWMLPSSIGFIAGSLLAPRLAGRPEHVIAGGLLLSAMGLMLLVHVHLPVGLFLFSLGLGPIPSLATGLVVGGAPPDRAGAAAALSETSSELGGALGIALLGSLGGALYRHHPGAIGDSLASAAVHTPAARAAFADAFTTIAMVSAAILVATAAFVARRARVTNDVLAKLPRS